MNNFTNICLCEPDICLCEFIFVFATHKYTVNGISRKVYVYAKSPLLEAESVNVVSSLWVTEGHHGRYQQVTLKVAPVGDPRDCHGITLAPN